MKLQQAVEAADSSVAERVTARGAAEARYARVHSAASGVQVQAGMGKHYEFAAVADAAEDAIATAATEVHAASAEVAMIQHDVDMLKSASTRATERSTLASLERARLENVMTEITSLVKERQNVALQKKKAATLVRNAYAQAMQEVLRAQSLQFAAENRLAAVRADSLNVINEARRNYEKMKSLLEDAVAQQMAAKQEAMKIQSEQLYHDTWAAAEMSDKELRRESMVIASRERASRHWREMQRKYQFARKAQEEATTKLEHSVLEMFRAAHARDALRVKNSSAVATSVDALLCAEETEAAAERKAKDTAAAVQEAWKEASSADEAVAAAVLSSSQIRHAREIARVRAENDLDSRNAAIMTLYLQKERREACAADLGKSNTALLEAECLSAEVEAAVRKNAASVSMSTAALAAVAHAREHVMTMASELNEAAEAVEEAEEIVRKWEVSCSESSLVVSKLAAKELKATEEEAAAVKKSLSDKNEALSLSQADIDARQELAHEQQVLIIARRRHEEVIALAEREDGVAARRMRLAEAEFADMHLASEQAFISVEKAAKAEADARLEIEAIDGQHPFIPQKLKARKASSAHFPASRREQKKLNETAKRSFGTLLSAEQKHALTRIITKVCMRRARATLVGWHDNVGERRHKRHVVQLSLSRLKAGVVLRAFHTWRAHTAQKQHERMTFDVFFHTPLMTVFFKAVRKGMLRAVRACISKGLDPTIARNHSGQSALHIAAAAGNVAMVNELLCVRVPINVQDKDGRTALHFAVENSVTKGHEDVICVLLEHFASTSIRDKMGKRAFEGVRQQGGNAGLR